MLKGFQAILGLLGGLLCPIALVVLGYFSIFKGLDWVYLVAVLGAYIICVVFAVLAVKKELRYSAYLQMMGGGIGWVWMLSIPVNIWFLISALFLGGSWWEVGYSIFVGMLCKGWLRAFKDAELEETQRSKD